MTTVDAVTQVGSVKGESLSWREIHAAAYALACRWADTEARSVFGVPTGGSVVAVFVAQHLGLPLVEQPDEYSIVVDDLIDSGRTISAYQEAGFNCDVLYRKPWSPDLCPGAELRTEWLRFPWEHEGGAPVDAVIRLLQFIGEDPTRDGLLDTPGRVIKALSEMTSGVGIDLGEVLQVSFDVDYTAPVIVSHLPFHSLCEHHMLPFVGQATLGYIPTGRVVGLSKLGRLLDALAHRLQVQERLTMQLVEAMVDHLHPAGAFAILDAEHSCMNLRGIRKTGVMTTMSFAGEFDTDPALRTMAEQHHRRPS